MNTIEVDHLDHSIQLESHQRYDNFFGCQKSIQSKNPFREKDRLFFNYDYSQMFSLHNVQDVQNSNDIPEMQDRGSLGEQYCPWSYGARGDFGIFFGNLNSFSILSIQTLNNSMGITIAQFQGHYYSPRLPLSCIFGMMFKFQTPCIMHAQNEEMIKIILTSTSQIWK